MYPTITAIAIAAVEAEQIRRRAFSMAVTVDGSDGSDGHPTSYSAAFDALAFGTDIARSDDGIELLGQPDPHAARLFVLSAGNVPADQLDDGPPSPVATCRTGAEPRAGVERADGWRLHREWSLRRRTELFRGWATVATAGELSPFSRTSMTFGRGWPIKPDIVLEGGNLLVDPSGTQFDQHDDVSLLTTSNASFRLLTTANATSAATAQAARLAAIAMEQYPEPMAGDGRAACSCTRPNGRRPCRRTSVPQGPRRANASSCCDATAGACPPRSGCSAARPAR